MAGNPITPKTEIPICHYLPPGIPEAREQPEAAAVTGGHDCPGGHVSVVDIRASNRSRVI